MPSHPVTDEWWDDDVTPFPGGGERALGTSPGRMMRCDWLVGSGFGIADSSACV